MSRGLELFEPGGTDQRPLLGCFPLYPPVELFHAMGLTPVVLWGLRGSVDGLGESDRHLQSYCCSVARRLVQCVLGAGAGLGGLFMYNACDTLRNLPEIIEAGLAEKGRAMPIFKLHLPMGSPEQEGAAGYLRRRIAALIDELSQAYGAVFCEERFRESVRLYGEIRALCGKLERRVAAGEISYADFSACIEQNFFRQAEEQLRELAILDRTGSAAPPPGGAKGALPGVVISGILPPPRPLITLIETAGLRVAGNDVAAQRRWYGYQPAVTGDPYAYYFDRYANHYPCPTLLYTADRRVEALLDYVRDTGARGVIFAGEKFCEYEYFEFPYLQRRLKENGISSVLLELSVDDTGESGAFKTRIEAFAEMLQTTGD